MSVTRIESDEKRPAAGAALTVHLDADGTLFNTPERKISNSFGSTRHGPVEGALINLSFFVIDLLPMHYKYLEKQICENGIKINGQIVGLAKELIRKGIKVDILTANGETDAIRKLVRDEQLDGVEVVRCSKRDKIKRGGILIDDSFVTLILSKLHSDGNAAQQVLVAGVHNSMLAKFAGLLGMRTASSIDDIRRHLGELGVIARQ